SLLDQIPIAGASLETATLEIILRRNLENICQRFFDQPRDLERLRKCRQAVQSAAAIPLPVKLWSIQNLCYAVRQNVYPEMKQANQSDWLSEFEQLVKLLGLSL
ncbi:MAG TPA: hypothetical protein VF146_06865, partial [Bryobacteraceae bacterium]